MGYGAIKLIHITLALTSVAGFILRWWWKQTSSPWIERRLVRMAPHVIDTLFLLSGIGLAMLLAQYPFVHTWLTAKILGLIAYIIAGSAAMKLTPRTWQSQLAFALALLIFAWIVSVARTRQPLGWLQLL